MSRAISTEYPATSGVAFEDEEDRESRIADLETKYDVQLENLFDQLEERDEQLKQYQQTISTLKAGHLGKTLHKRKDRYRGGKGSSSSSEDGVSKPVSWKPVGQEYDEKGNKVIYEVLQVTDSSGSEGSESNDERPTRRTTQSRARLKRSLDSLGKEKSDTEHKLASVLEEFDSVKQKYDDLFEKHKHLDEDSASKIDDLAEKLKHYVCRCNELESKPAGNDADVIAKYEKRIKMLNDKLSQKSKAIDESDKTITKIKSKLEEDNCIMKKNNEDIKQKLLQKDTQLEQLRDAIKNQSIDSGEILKEIRAENRQLKQEINNLNRNTQSEGIDQGYMTHNYSKMRRDFYDVCDKKIDLEEKLKVLEQTNDKLRMENTKASETFSRKENLTILAKENYNKLKKMYDEVYAKTNDYEKTIGELSEENSALRTNKAKPKSDHVYEGQKVQELKKEVEKIRNSKEGTEETCNNLRETIKGLESELTQAKGHIKEKDDAVEGGIEELKKQEGDFVKSKEESEIASNSLRETIKDLESELDQAQGKIKEKEDAVIGVSNDYRGLKASYDDVCVANQKVEEKLKETLYEILTLKEQIELLNAHLTEKEVFASDVAYSYDSLKNETKDELQSIQKECEILQSQLKTKYMQIIDVAQAYNQFKKKSAKDSASENDLRKRLEDEIVASHEENENLKNKVEESDGCIVTEKEGFEKLKRDYNDVCKENKELVYQRLEYKEKKHLLVQEIESLKDERDSNVDVNKVPMQRYNQLRDEYYQMCKENGDLEYKWKSHADENNDLKEKVEIMREDIDKKKEILEKTTDDFRLLKLEHEKFLKTNTELSEKMEYETEKNQLLKADLQNSKKEIRNQKDILLEVTFDKEELLLKIETMNYDNKAVEEKLNAQNVKNLKLDEEIDQLSSTLKEKDENTREIKNFYDTLKNEYDQLNSKFITYKEHSTVDAQNLSQKNHECDSLLEHLKTKESETCKLMEDLDKYKSEYDNLVKKNSELLKKHTSVVDENSILAKQSEDSKANVKERLKMKEEFDILKNEYESTSDQKNALEGSLQKSNEEMENKGSVIKSLEETIKEKDRLERELIKGNDELNKLNEELKETLENLENKMKLLSEEKEKNEEENQKTIFTLKEDISMLLERYDDVSRKLTCKEALVEKMESDITKLRQDYTDVSNKEASEILRNQSIVGENSSLKEQFEEMKAKVNEGLKAKEELDHLKKEYEGTLNEKNALESSLDNSNEENDNKVSVIESLQVKINEKEEIEKEMIKSNEELKKLNEESKETFKNLEKKMEVLTEEGKSKEEESQKTVKTLTEDMSSLIQKYDDVSSKLADEEELSEKLENDITKLRQDYINLCSDNTSESQYHKAVVEENYTLKQQSKESKERLQEGLRMKEEFEVLKREFEDILNQKNAFESSLDKSNKERENDKAVIESLQETIDIKEKVEKEMILGNDQLKKLNEESKEAYTNLENKFELLIGEWTRKEEDSQKTINKLANELNETKINFDEQSNCLKENEEQLRLLMEEKYLDKEKSITDDQSFGNVQSKDNKKLAPPAIEEDTITIEEGRQVFSENTSNEEKYVELMDEDSEKKNISQSKETEKSSPKLIEEDIIAVDEGREVCSENTSDFAQSKETEKSSPKLIEEDIIGVDEGREVCSENTSDFETFFKNEDNKFEKENIENKGKMNFPRNRIEEDVIVANEGSGVCSENTLAEERSDELRAKLQEGLRMKEEFEVLKRELEDILNEKNALESSLEKSNKERENEKAIVESLQQTIDIKDKVEQEMILSNDQLKQLNEESKETFKNLKNQMEVLTEEKQSKEEESENTLKTLKDDMSTLLQKYDDVSSKLDDKEAFSEKLENDITKLRQDYINLCSDNTSESQYHKAVVEENYILKQQSEESKAKLQEGLRMKEEFEVLKRDLEVILNEKNALESSLDKSNEERENDKSMIEHLQGTIDIKDKVEKEMILSNDQLNNSTRNLNETFKNLKNQMERLTEEKKSNEEESQNTVKTLKDDMSRLLQRYDDVSSKLADKETLSQKLENDITKLRQDYINLCNDNTSQSQYHKAVVEENYILKQQSDESKAKLQEGLRMKEEFEVLKREFEDILNEKNALEGSLDKSNEERENDKSMIERLQGTIDIKDKVEKEMGLSNDQLKQLNEESKGTFNNLKHQMELLTEEKKSNEEESQNTVKALKDDMSRLLQKCDDVSSKLADKEALSEKLENDITKLRQDYINLCNDNTSESQYHKAVVEENYILKQQSDESKAKLQDGQRIKEEFDVLKREFEDMLNQKNSLESSLDKSNEEKESDKSMIERLQGTIDMNDKLEKEMILSNDQLKQLNEESKEAFKNLENQMANLTEERNSKEEEYQKTVNALKDDMFRTKEELEVLQREFEGILSQKNALECSLEKFNEESENDKSIIERLQRTIDMKDKLEKEMVLSNDQLKQLNEESKEEFKNLENQMENLTEEKKRKEEESEKTVKGLKDDMSRTKEELEVLQREFEGILSQKNALECSLEKFNEESENDKSMIERLQGTIDIKDKAEKEMITSNDQLKQLNEKSKEAFKILENQMENLTEEYFTVKSLAEDMSRTKEEFEVLQREFEDILSQKNALECSLEKFNEESENDKAMIECLQVTIDIKDKVEKEMIMSNDQLKEHNEESNEAFKDLVNKMELLNEEKLRKEDDSEKAITTLKQDMSNLLQKYDDTSKGEFTEKIGVEKAKLRQDYTNLYTDDIAEDISSLKENYNELKENYSVLTNTNYDLEEECKDLLESIKEKEKTNERITDDLRKAKKTLDGICVDSTKDQTYFKMENDNLSEKNIELEEECEHLRLDILKREELAKNMSLEINQLRIDYEEKGNANTSPDFIDLKKNFDDLQTKHAALEGKHTGLQKDIEDRDFIKSKTEDELQNLKKEYDNIRSRENYSSDHKGLQQENNKLHILNIDLQKESETLRSNLKDMEEDGLKLERDFLKVKKNYDDLLKDKKDESGNLEEIKKVAGILADKDSWKEKYDRICHEVSVRNETFSIMKKDYDRLKTDYESLHHKNIELEEKRKSVEEETLNLKEEFENSRVEISEKEEFASKTIKDYNNLKSQYDDLCSRLGESIETLTDSNCKLKQQNEMLGVVMKEKDNNAEKLRDELSVFEKKYDDVYNKNIDVENAKQGLAEENCKIKEESDDLLSQVEAQTASLNELANELEESKIYLDEQSNILKQKEEELRQLMEEKTLVEKFINEEYGKRSVEGEDKKKNRQTGIEEDMIFADEGREVFSENTSDEEKYFQNEDQETRKLPPRVVEEENISAEEGREVQSENTLDYGNFFMENIVSKNKKMLPQTGIEEDIIVADEERNMFSEKDLDEENYLELDDQDSQSKEKEKLRPEIVEEENIVADGGREVQSENTSDYENFFKNENNASEENYLSIGDLKNRYVNHPKEMMGMIGYLSALGQEKKVYNEKTPAIQIFFEESENEKNLEERAKNEIHESADKLNTGNDNSRIRKISFERIVKKDGSSPVHSCNRSRTQSESGSYAGSVRAADIEEYDISDLEDEHVHGMDTHTTKPDKKIDDVYEVLKPYNEKPIYETLRAIGDLYPTLGNNTNQNDEVGISETTPVETVETVETFQAIRSIDALYSNLAVGNSINPDDDVGTSEATPIKTVKTVETHEDFETDSNSSYLSACEDLHLDEIPTWGIIENDVFDDSESEEDLVEISIVDINAEPLYQEEMLKSVEIDGVTFVSKDRNEHKAISKSSSKSSIKSSIDDNGFKDVIIDVQLDLLNPDQLEQSDEKWKWELRVRDLEIKRLRKIIEEKVLSKKDKKEKAPFFAFRSSKKSEKKKSKDVPKIEFENLYSDFEHSLVFDNV